METETFALAMFTSEARTLSQKFNHTLMNTIKYIAAGLLLLWLIVCLAMGAERRCDFN